MVEFLAMGGYGAYVWAAFGLAVAVLAGLFWQSWRLARKRTAELEALRARAAEARPRRPRPIVARREPGPSQPVAADPAPSRVGEVS